MLYNNNFSYPTPLYNGGNYNMGYNRNSNTADLNMSMLPANQTARVYLKALPVTSLEEAKAAIVDLDGSMYVFVNVSQGEIYTKQYNLANGTSDFLTYKLLDKVNSPQYVTVEAMQGYNDTLKQLVEEVKNLKGEIGNVRPVTNAVSSNGFQGKKQQ